MLECEAEGETPIGIIWKKDSLTLEPDQEVRYDTLEVRYDTLEVRYDTLEVRYDTLEVQ